MADQMTTLTFKAPSGQTREVQVKGSPNEDQLKQIGEQLAKEMAGEGQAQAPAQAQDFSDVEGGGASANAPQGNPFVRAVGERLKPVADLADVAIGLTERRLPTAEKAVSAAAGAGTLAASTTPAGVGIQLAGAGLQGLAESAGMSVNSSRLLSVAGELALGAGGLIRAGSKAAAEGGRMLSNAARTTVGRMTSREALGAELGQAARTTLLSNKRTLGGAIDTLEKQIGRTIPSIDNASPAYGTIADTISAIDERVIKFPADVTNAIETIRANQMAGLPIPMDQVMKLRTRLRQLANFKDSADPDLAIAGKNAGLIRRKLTDAIEDAIPDQQLAGRYAEARTAYNSQYATPWRQLKSVVARNVTPAQAFNKVFNPNDMQAFRALTDAVGGNPGIRGRLQMGFLESLSDATQGYQQAEAALGRFNQMRPALGASGIFSPQELDALSVILQKKQMPGLMDRVKGALDQPLTLRKGGVVIPTLGFLAFHNPALAIGAMVGAGALPYLRRAMILPADSPASQRLMRLAIAKIEPFAKTLKQTEGPAVDEGQDYDSE